MIATRSASWGHARTSSALGRRAVAGGRRRHVAHARGHGVGRGGRAAAGGVGGRRRRWGPALSALARGSGRRGALAAGAGIALVGCGLLGMAGVVGAVPLVLSGSVLLGARNTAVMLGRYAAADLVEEADRPRAMGSVLAATAIGAVAAPNLLGPDERPGGTRRTARAHGPVHAGRGRLRSDRRGPHGAPTRRGPRRRPGRPAHRPVRPPAPPEPPWGCWRW